MDLIVLLQCVEAANMLVQYWQGSPSPLLVPCFAALMARPSKLHETDVTTLTLYVIIYTHIQATYFCLTLRITLYLFLLPFDS